MKFSALIFVLFAILCIVAAKGGDGDKGKGKGRENREVTKSEETEREVKFESKFKAVGVEGKLSFSFKVEENGPVVLGIKAYNKNDDVVSKFRARIGFEKIVQYRENTTVPHQDGFQPGTDVEAAILYISNLTFNAVSCNEDGDTGVWECQVSSKDGQFKVDTVITPTETNATGVPTKPSSVKFSVYLNLLSRAADTNISLVTLVRSGAGSQVIVRDQSEEESEGFSGHREREVVVGEGSISWGIVAEQNNAEIPVYHSQPIPLTESEYEDDDDEDDEDDDRKHDHDDDEDDDDDHKLMMIFSFGTTANGLITWDPKLIYGGSFSAAAGIRNTASVFVVLAALAFLF